MGDRMLVVPVLVIVALGCASAIAWRLRLQRARRADAEARRAAVLEDMQRLTAELRRQSADQPMVDPSLPPGERLRRMYPGARDADASRANGAGSAR